MDKGVNIKMPKEPESYIRSYEVTLGAGAKQKVLFNIPSEKKFTITHVIFHSENSGDFEVRNDIIKHFKENAIVIYNSIMDTLLPLYPHGVVMSGSRAGFNVTNLSNAEAVLDFVLIGRIE